MRARLEKLLDERQARLAPAPETRPLLDETTERALRELEYVE